MSSRNLHDLHPDLLPIALQFVQDCNKQGVEPLIYCTWRSPQEQDLDYAKGRTAPGKIVTFKKGGQSLHNFTLNGAPASKAFDCVPLVNSRLDWDGEGPEWDKMVKIGESIGLKWGGRWLMKDKAHWELNEKGA